MILAVPGYANRPESAVARDITKETSVAICGADDNAGARMTLHRYTICLAILIVGAGDEGFNDLDIDLFDAVQLG